MPKYTAFTSSGARYVVDTDRQWWTHASEGYPVDTSEPLRAFKVFDLDELRGMTNSEAWAYVGSLPEASEPEVGKVMYLHGGISDGVWRRSMPVTQWYVIEDVPTDDN